MSVQREVGMRPWVAGATDLVVVAVFVLLGRRTHHEDAGVVGFFRVFWPFALGLIVAWWATRLFRAPLAWRPAVGAWLLTVAIGIALRVVVQGHDLVLAFTIVALVFLGAGMLGWRAVVRLVRGRARPARAA